MLRNCVSCIFAVVRLRRCSSSAAAMRFLHALWESMKAIPAITAEDRAPMPTAMTARSDGGMADCERLTGARNIQIPANRPAKKQKAAKAKIFLDKESSRLGTGVRTPSAHAAVL